MEPTAPHRSIISDPLPEKDILGGGVCFKPRAEGVVVDTIIIHSCFVPDSIINPALGAASSFSDEAAKRAIKAWLDGKNREKAEEDPEVKLRLGEENQALEFHAIHHLIGSRHGESGLSTYSKDAIRDMFQFYGVSAHYLIDRAGHVYEFVSPDFLAFHAGKSQMPRAEDARTGVNAFSVGIELLGTTVSGYSAEQYVSLISLTRDLIDRYSIKNIYGHNHIAPGRKTDPDSFDWNRYIEQLSPHAGSGIHYPEL